MPTYNHNIKEEELKNCLRTDYFGAYDANAIIGNIDFAVAPKNASVGANNHSPLQPRDHSERQYFLWAESKKGANSDIHESFAQLILTIGKARTFEKHLPPAFLGAFDAAKIAFVPYNAVMEVFYKNDFNWNVAPSDHGTKEFKELLALVRGVLEKESTVFRYDTDGKELKEFIKTNFTTHVGANNHSPQDSVCGGNMANNHSPLQNIPVNRIQIDKNNFTTVYQKWRDEVMPTISVTWEAAKKIGIIEADFYLADLLSGPIAGANNYSPLQNNGYKTLIDKLFVVLNADHYDYAKAIDEMGLFKREAGFRDGQKAHTAFWNRYDRPPRKEYWDYIFERRDLLVPQDVRERKGSFFTPQKWVELSQQYLAQTLGEDWQDEYYVWDCCAGTGNLLAGLTNKYNIFASTLDQADVDVMKERIGNGANLAPNNVFQFDFLNDDFSKLPQTLQGIINSPEERKKLVIYINPPYAEATTKTTISGTGANKAGVAMAHKTNSSYKETLGTACNELFAQILYRAYKEVGAGVIAQFSTPKHIMSVNFRKFRAAFRPKLSAAFLVPADTFDNVSGQFPIGFFVWDARREERFRDISADVYNAAAESLGAKRIAVDDCAKTLNDWLKTFDKEGEFIGCVPGCPPDFQHNEQAAILSKPQARYCNNITDRNVMCFAVYFAVRQCIPLTWLNNKDQFFYPKETWATDYEFQTDCLVYALFHSKNRISSAQGPNHWIPFREEEVGAPGPFQSRFMSDYLRNSQCIMRNSQLFAADKDAPGYVPLGHLSEEAQTVMSAGRELWRYYHRQPIAAQNTDASLYDIRLHFQKANQAGKMNPTSEDVRYMELLGALKAAMKALAGRIEEGVYRHGFLMG